MQYVLLPNWHEKFMETSLMENIFMNIGTIIIMYALVASSNLCAYYARLIYVHVCVFGWVNCCDE